MLNVKDLKRCNKRSSNKARGTMLILDEKGFKTKSITEHKEGQ